MTVAQPADLSFDNSPYIPNADELAALIPFWLRKAIASDREIRVLQCEKSSCLVNRDKEWERLHQISKILGEDQSHTLIEEAYLQIAQEWPRNRWIVTVYGTESEMDVYRYIINSDEEEEALTAGDIFWGTNARHKSRTELAILTSTIIERVLQHGTQPQQLRLVKGELERYYAQFPAFWRGPRHSIVVLGIEFPIGVKQLLENIGIEDPNPDLDDTTFYDTLDQGKALLVALDETAQKGEQAFKDLLNKIMGGF